MESLGNMKEQVCWGNRSQLVAVCVQSSALEWKGLGSHEPQHEVGPEQTNRHAWPLPEGHMWKSSDESRLPFKGVSLAVVKADKRGRIRLQVVQRGTHAIQTEAA